MTSETPSMEKNVSNEFPRQEVIEPQQHSENLETQDIEQPYNYNSYLNECQVQANIDIEMLDEDFLERDDQSLPSGFGSPSSSLIHHAELG